MRTYLSGTIAQQEPVCLPRAEGDLVDQCSGLHSLLSVSEGSCERDDNAIIFFSK